VAVGTAMIPARWSRASARLGAFVIGLAAALCAVAALAQVPIPVDEQVRLFNSMSPAQQQQLIRELQRSLPPAQRQAIIGMLQGGGGADQTAEELDPDAEAALGAAIQGQSVGEQRDDRDPRLEPGDTIVIQFEEREDDPRALLRTAEEQQQLPQFLERLQGSPQSLRIDALELTRHFASDQVGATISITRTIVDRDQEMDDIDTARLPSSTEVRG
jgi:hypothetical protein